MECAISNLEFGGGWKIWGEKCYLESRIWGVENAISNLQFGWVENSISNPIFGVENLGWKVLSRISNLGGGGGKFGGRMLSRISNLGGWKIWGGKCYLESRIWGAENLGEKMLARIFNLGG